MDTKILREERKNHINFVNKTLKNLINFYENH